jgi:RND family efflux transporter MFP subunit
MNYFDAQPLIAMYTRISVSLALAFFVLLFQCTGRRNESELPATQKIAVKPTPVTISQSEMKNFERVIQGTGRIRSYYQESIVSPTTGIVVRSTLYNGRMVTAGDTLIVFDNKDLQLKKARARAKVSKAKLEYQNLLFGYSRSAETISDSLDNNLRVISGLSDAQIELEEVTLAIENSCVVAPISGTIADVNITTRMNVKSGDTIFTIYSDKRLYLEIKVLETDWPHLALNQPATINVLGRKQTYKGAVENINPIVDENGLVSVKILILETTALIPGMTAVANLPLRMERCLIIPKQAVVIRDGRSIVFTIVKQKAKWNFVTTAKENGQEIEIVSGINAGEQVIVSNNLHLVDGTPVIIGEY